jgi:Domain of unknown function (DUF4149)
MAIQRLHKILNTLRTLLLGAWIGAAIFFSASVAPSVFAALRFFNVSNSGEVAGAIVNRTLAAVNISGFFVAVLALVVGFIMRKSYSSRAFLTQSALLGLVALATAVGQWIIAAKMHSLRLAMGRPMDQIPSSDPNRMAFAALHGYSVGALSIALIAALIAFFVISYRKD